MVSEIDRSDPTPLYQQLYQILQDHILMGDWVPGVLLPTEKEICEEYQVSRITVRKSLDELVRKGLIERMQGRGSIVVDRMQKRQQQNVHGFHALMEQQGAKASVKLLKKEIKQGDQYLDKLFGISPDDNLFWYFSRLCFVNDQPTTLINTFVKKSLGDKLIQYDLENESFFELYERITKSPILYYENIITAVNISPRIAKLMQVEPNSAQLWQRGVVYIQKDVPIEASYSIYRSDFYEFDVNNYKFREDGIGKMDF